VKLLRGCLGRLILLLLLLLLSLVRDGLGSPEFLLVLCVRTLDVLPASLKKSLLLLVLPDPLHVVVGDVADDLRVGLESLSLRVVCYLGELPLGRLEVGVVLDVGLDFGVRRQPHVLRSVSNHRGLSLWHVGTTVGQLVEALVVLHVEDHVAHLAPKTVLVPDLLKAFELLHRVNRLPALGAKLGHLDLNLTLSRSHNSLC